MGRILKHLINLTITGIKKRLIMKLQIFSIIVLSVVLLTHSANGQMKVEE